MTRFEVVEKEKIQSCETDYYITTLQCPKCKCTEKVSWEVEEDEKFEPGYCFCDNTTTEMILSEDKTILSCKKIFTMYDVVTFIKEYLDSGEHNLPKILLMTEEQKTYFLNAAYFPWCVSVKKMKNIDAINTGYNILKVKIIKEV